METDPKYSVEEQLLNETLRGHVDRKEHFKYHKRVRIMSYLLQYLVPTLFVATILMR